MNKLKQTVLSGMAGTMFLLPIDKGKINSTQSFRDRGDKMGKSLHKDELLLSEKDKKILHKIILSAISFDDVTPGYLRFNRRTIPQHLAKYLDYLVKNNYVKLQIIKFYKTGGEQVDLIDLADDMFIGDGTNDIAQVKYDVVFIDRFEKNEYLFKKNDVDDKKKDILEEEFEYIGGVIVNTGFQYGYEGKFQKVRLGYKLILEKANNAFLSELLFLNNRLIWKYKNKRIDLFDKNGVLEKHKVDEIFEYLNRQMEIINLRREIKLVILTSLYNFDFRVVDEDRSVCCNEDYSIFFVDKFEKKYLIKIDVDEKLKVKIIFPVSNGKYRLVSDTDKEGYYSRIINLLSWLVSELKE